MRRRDFIKVIAGSTALLPFAADAPQSERKRQVGILMGLAADDPEAQDRIGVFEETLHQLGWTEIATCKSNIAVVRVTPMSRENKQPN